LNFKVQCLIKKQWEQWAAFHWVEPIGQKGEPWAITVALF